MILNSSAARSTWYFLGAITAVESFVILSSPKMFFAALTLRAAETPPIGWILAAVVALATILYTARALGI